MANTTMLAGGWGGDGASERESPVHGVSVHTDSMLALPEKVARIKQAREEAYKEVRQYEDQLKDQLKSAEAGGAVQGDKSAKLAQETEKQLMDIRKSAEVKNPPVFERERARGRHPRARERASERASEGENGATAVCILYSKTLCSYVYQNRKP